MHAYLIEAHKSDYTLETLLKLLDDDRNDIFIHMDKKNDTFNENYFCNLLKKSNLYFTERINVNWGAYSQIEAELILLETAINHRKYEYLHLLSGQDLPIKSQDYIHNFFHQNEGREFVRFQNSEFQQNDRVSYFHTFQEILPRDNRFFNRINQIFLNIQKFLGIKRNKNIIFQKGTNWFSITSDLAQYVLDSRSWIRKTFKYTFCADEIFLQTLIINSEFKDRLYNKEFNNDLISIMRLIDWNRGAPYTFELKDIDEIASSSMLFARKFDASTDRDIIEKIYKQISMEQNL